MLVMVNFMYHLGWGKGCPDSWWNILSGCVCEGTSKGDISIWICRLNKEDDSHQCRWASPNLLRSWIEQKGEGRANLLFAGTGTSTLSWDISTPGSQAFGLRLNYTIGFPRSPACGQQIMGFLSFHNCISQFLKITLSIYIYIYIYIYTHTHICTYIHIYMLFVPFLWTTLFSDHLL